MEKGGQYGLQGLALYLIRLGQRDSGLPGEQVFHVKGLPWISQSLLPRLVAALPSFRLRPT